MLFPVIRMMYYVLKQRAQGEHSLRPSVPFCGA